MNRSSLYAAAALLCLAGPASASKSYDCRHYADAMGILTGAVEAWYTGCDLVRCMHNKVIKQTYQDMSDVSEWAVTQTKDTPKPAADPSDTSGGDCGAVKSAGQAFRDAVLAAKPAFDEAAAICTQFPHSEEEADACHPKAKVAFEKEVAITGDGGKMDAFLSVARANPRCTDLKLNDEAALNGDTMEGVYVRVKKAPCQRDDRCSFTRINGLRKAREEMMKIFSPGKDMAPRDLQTAAAACRPLLFAQRGEASDEAMSGEEGAENLLWHASTYNTYWGGSAKDPTHLLMVGTSKVAICLTYLEEGWERAECQAVYDADPQAAH